MDLFQAVILGIVEGITEFLPVSSTGHLIVVQKLFAIPITDAVKSFDIVIQLGAIAAAVWIYRAMIFGSRRILLLVLSAFLPTAVLGFLLHGVVKTYLLGSVGTVVSALFIGGVILIGFERLHPVKQLKKSKVEKITIQQAVIIGCAQSLALIPGTSRSAATIVGGMLLGIDRKTIVDFSFLLAIPTMAAATALDFAKSAGSFSSHDALTIAIGFVVSFITAWFAIQWLLKFIQTHTFVPFGIYRIALALILWIFLLG